MLISRDRVEDKRALRDIIEMNEISGGLDEAIMSLQHKIDTHDYSEDEGRRMRVEGLIRTIYEKN